MTEQRTPKFWHWAEDAEDVSFTTIDAAVKDYVEYQDKVQPTDQPLSIPEYVTLYGYAPMPLDTPDPEWILEQVLDHIEAENGSPDVEGPKQPTDRMRAAASEFIDVVAAEWGDSYWCDMMETRQVRVRDYVEVDDE